MNEEEQPQANLSGSFLVASPSLVDPNFNQTVVLISAHDDEDGALGVVVNRPIHKCLGEIDDRFAGGPLAQVPVYHGGPVSDQQMILSAWRTIEGEQAFKLYFGISEDKAIEILESEPEAEVR